MFRRMKKVFSLLGTKHVSQHKKVSMSMSEEPESSLPTPRAPQPEFLTETRFDEFDLPADVLAGLKDAGFTHCTPIQAQTLPVALTGRDVAGQAQTGTGKTGAFLVTMTDKTKRRIIDRGNQRPFAVRRMAGLADNGPGVGSQPPPQIMNLFRYSCLSRHIYRMVDLALRFHPVDVADLTELGVDVFNTKKNTLSQFRRLLAYAMGGVTGTAIYLPFHIKRKCCRQPDVV